MGASKERTRPHVASARVDDETHQWLLDLAAKNETTISLVVEALILQVKGMTK